MSEQDEPTYPCKVCGRRFIKSSLVSPTLSLFQTRPLLQGKHESACKKLNNLHRKPFDSGKQRAANSDVPYEHVKKAAKEKEKVLFSFFNPFIPMCSKMNIFCLGPPFGVFRSSWKIFFLKNRFIRAPLWPSDS